MFNRILIPVDLAEPKLADAALRQAAELAKASSAEIRLIYVRPFMVEAALSYLPKDFFAKEEKEAEQGLRALADSLDLPATRVSVISPTGNVYDHVLSALADFNADLIVIGSHRPARSTYLLGSNAARIVRHANCSVLVVR